MSLSGFQINWIDHNFHLQSEHKNLPLSCKTLYLESDVILTVPAVKTLDTPYFHNKVWLPKSRTTQVNNMFEPDTAT